MGAEDPTNAHDADGGKRVNVAKESNGPGRRPGQDVQPNIPEKSTFPGRPSRAAM
jgi:hypothetical protein